MNARLGLVLLFMLATAACATRDRVVLLPDAGGKVGKLAVINAGGETLLDSAYDSARVNARGAVRRETTDAAQVRARFGAALDALPPRPVSYLLYFLGDSDQLTDESRRLAASVMQEIARRPVAEIVVIGHTDRQGSLEYNDQLSLARANAVRRQLVELGVDPQRLSVAGRGEREPLVQTADDVAEARNRRAELSVR